MKYAYQRKYAEYKKLKNYIIPFKTIQSKKKDVYSKYFNGNGIVFDDENINENGGCIFTVKVCESIYKTPYDMGLLNYINIPNCGDWKGELLMLMYKNFWTTPNFFSPHKKYFTFINNFLKIKNIYEDDIIKIGVHLRSLKHYHTKTISIDEYIDSYIEIVLEIRHSLNNDNSKKIVVVIASDGKHQLETIITKLKELKISYVYIDDSMRTDGEVDWWNTNVSDKNGNDKNVSFNDIYDACMKDATLLIHCDYLISGHSNFSSYVIGNFKYPNNIIKPKCLIDVGSY